MFFYLFIERQSAPSCRSEKREWYTMQCL